MWKTALLLAMALALPTVQVPSTRTPVDKSYRKMLQGVELFKREHALAPQATLRFRLLQRQPGTDMTGIQLKLVGDTTSMAVPVAADNSFTLDYQEQLWREDAAVLANRKTLSMTWRADVRSPGVPEGMRRLGDLRLECLVGMQAGLVSNNAHLFAWLDEFLRSPDKVCSDPNGNYLFFTERPLFAITLQAGARRASLPFHALYAGNPPPAEMPYCDCQVMLDSSYFAPVWDRSWPDDTLLAFEYMDDPPPASGAAPQDRNAALASLGPPQLSIHFDSGREAWLYQSAPPIRLDPAADGRPRLGEHVLLFAPDGSTLKARQRAP
ncbi:hypothetical protein [Pseudoduganella violaceinigra]|uniref:hypothetical protein n=1 Tax=Pseudoduganella violaceinigra TaxID=246602 RepID=UPI00040704C2|nr:hypothetical protein [Pseudoduganella violaceinigra]